MKYTEKWNKIIEKGEFTESIINEIIKDITEKNIVNVEDLVEAINKIQDEEIKTKLTEELKTHNKDTLEEMKQNTEYLIETTEFYNHKKQQIKRIWEVPNGGPYDYIDWDKMIEDIMDNTLDYLEIGNKTYYYE